MTYESPRVTELGSVADFTRADRWALDWDGRFLHANYKTPPPTS
ncbi:MAG TPA: lasso RiPP family leader peptide-containing protein [Ilumatobacteraceae bacterium]|nr:lasso RiPP family leader peptide-containing protein [Ilumatobacteraceae bacterium]